MCLKLQLNVIFGIWICTDPQLLLLRLLQVFHALQIIGGSVIPVQTTLSNEEEGYLLPTWARKITFPLMTTGASSRNVDRLFCELKLVTDNLFIYAGANWEATERLSKYLVCLFSIVYASNSHPSVMCNGVFSGLILFFRIRLLLTMRVINYLSAVISKSRY